MSAQCVVCLRPAACTHPVVGALCAEHTDAATTAQVQGADPREVVRTWRAAILAGALDYLETHTGPDGQTSGPS